MVAVAHHGSGERLARGVDRVPVQVTRAVPGFVAGEASAVLAALEGRPGRPRDKRKRAVEWGLNGRPTLVQNAETLAHVALLARYGHAWFRQIGTPAEPGTFLATISGAVASPGVVEAACGAPLGHLLELAGGATEPLRALLVGGYHGAWLPAGPAAELAMSRAALEPWGADPGAGVVLALPAGQCGLVATARILDYLAQQSAHQCGPCLNGLPALAGLLARLARGDRDPDLAAGITRLAGVVDGRGACHHPDGTVRLLRSALDTFADDVQAHLDGTCSVEGGSRER